MTRSARTSPNGCRHSSVNARHKRLTRTSLYAHPDPGGPPFASSPSRRLCQSTEVGFPQSVPCHIEVCCSRCSHVIEVYSPTSNPLSETSSRTRRAGVSRPSSYARPATTETTLLVALKSISGVSGFPHVANVLPAWMTHPLAPVAPSNGPNTSRFATSATWRSKYSEMSCTPGVNAARRSLARRAISSVPPTRTRDTSFVYHATSTHRRP